MDFSLVKANTESAYLGGWRSAHIEECGEKLVKVEDEVAHSWYCHEMGLTDSPDLYLREGVYAMFNSARTILRGVGYDLRVYDGWRPVGLQETLFWYYFKLFTIKQFGLEDFFSLCQTGKQISDKLTTLPQGLRDKLMEVNKQYVSWPSTGAVCPSPHATGGAVDVWLFEDDMPVDLGVPFDWMEENAGAFYHLNNDAKPWQCEDSSAVNFRREILLRAMICAGFTCYPHEIWHFNFGNQMDATVRGGQRSLRLYRALATILLTRGNLSSRQHYLSIV